MLPSLPPWALLPAEAAQRKAAATRALTPAEYFFPGNPAEALFPPELSEA
jgi:hypothetical protein